MRLDVSFTVLLATHSSLYIGDHPATAPGIVGNVMTLTDSVDTDSVLPTNCCSNTRVNASNTLSSAEIDAMNVFVFGEFVFYYGVSLPPNITVLVGGMRSVCQRLSI